jgi:two-component system chemotaxis sensor kinase CheA
MPKLVRDLAQSNGKDVELVVRGATLEVDRQILEQIKTPLTHLVRNAIDHGIETPAERQRVGKPARGRITIDITPHEGNRVQLVIADDGAGIALAKVKQRAARMGLLDVEPSPWSPSQLTDLVFESGLSTSPIVTDLSGHGLGLAIVREKIERLGGSVSVESPPPEGGTRFCIVLPSTLATFRGLLVGVAGETFVLPSRSVERVARVSVSAVQTAADGGDTVVLDGRTMPLVALSDLLDLPPRPAPAVTGVPRMQLVVVGSADKCVALAVDEVFGDQEVLVKPLAAPLRRVRNVAGATLLGGGRVVVLLNVTDLLKSAALHRQRGARAVRAADGEPRGSLLVAEDSVTTRLLLKTILESAGYRVTTAADGIDALASLQSGEFDLLVSDVEMPRLDGFGLTARVRTDKRLADLPVVLVTALDSRADKERGVEVGANAYIVKSAFDQARLLQTIRTLI